MLNRLDRLDALETLLLGREFNTIKSLADALEVSPRTLARDLKLLKQRGLSIESDRGRGGGVQLMRQWGSGKIKLDYDEAVDLLISLAVAEKMNSPIFMTNNAHIRRKVSASFDQDMQAKVAKLRQRIFVTGPASKPVHNSYKAVARTQLQRIQSAFLQMQCAEINYVSVSGEKTVRAIEAHYLILSFPVWYVFAWDQLRQDTRTFRFDRIKKVEVLEQNFRLHNKKQFKQHLDSFAASI